MDAEEYGFGKRIGFGNYKVVVLHLTSAQPKHLFHVN